MVKCPKCGRVGSSKIIRKRTALSWGADGGPKIIPIEIKRECGNCQHKWSTKLHKNWRWVRSSRLDKWVLVPPKDRDWERFGVTQDDMKKKWGV